jgi:hypothetical protein
VLRRSLALLVFLLVASACGWYSPQENASAFGSPYSAGHRTLLSAWQGVFRPTACLTGGVPIDSSRYFLKPQQRYLHRRAEALIEAEITKTTTARTLAAKGVLLLLSQRSNRAVDILQRATLKPDCPASVWSDLGAALLVRSRARSDSYDLVAALVATQQALSREPRMRQALFNRFSILENMQLRGAATAARREFLQECQQSSWCDIARLDHDDEPTESLSERVRRTLGQMPVQAAGDWELRRTIVAAPQAGRAYLEEELLVDWSNEVLRGGNGRRQQSLAGRLGNQLLTVTGDHLPRDEAVCLDFLGRESTMLAVSFRLYFDAMHAYHRSEIEQAEDGFRRSAMIMERLGCSFSHWATFYQAVCGYYRKDFSAAEHSFAAIELLAIRRGYLNLAGRTGWMRGLTDALPEGAGAIRDNAGRGKSRGIAFVDCGGVARPRRSPCRVEPSAEGPRTTAQVWRSRPTQGSDFRGSPRSSDKR